MRQVVIGNPVINSPFEERSYYPDFLVRLREPDGEALSLSAEVTGASRTDEQAKVGTAKHLWVPAVDNHGRFGRWGFVQITDPWSAQAALRGFLANLSEAHP